MWNPLSRVSVFAWSCGLVCLCPAAPAPAAQAVNFNRDIRPVLSDKCFQCHGPDAEDRQADLRFDVEESAKADLGGYRVIVPGKPDESELVARVTTDDDDLRMPPADSGKDLTADEIDLLKTWIEQGAIWSQHWAYVPPTRHAPPRPSDPEWPLNWIDAFILQRLDAERLAPSPTDGPVTLIRRLSFDLTGLPPAPDEVDQFVNDDGSAAYERLVDRLLASDHYGERMAMYWLDLVRYADTVGYHGDQDHNISPYRDYVIDAFNENLPFDQFTREQLAGDLLAEPSIDQKIATGYNRLLQTSHEGGVQPNEYLAIYAADRVRNVSAVWMGATLGCAQCHDHKYDPYTTKDFYSMAAFFADVDEAQHFRSGTNSLPTKRLPEMKVLTRRERNEIERLEEQIAKWESELTATAADQQATVDDLKQRMASAKQQHEAIKNSARSTMVTVSIEPREIRVLPRGNWLNDSGPIVQPAVPKFLGGVNVESERATRLDLANWLTSTGNGAGHFTARVFANRFWYLFFGGGLARDLDDFGGQGEPPVHPELLDRLAIEFVDSGWNVKQLVKLIVMSRVYRQSSRASDALRRRDPDNRLFARQASYRLPAETVRDNALAISGLLVREVGGGSVKPYQPAGYYKHLNFPQRSYKHHADNRQWRRGVYVHWQRQFLHPMLRAMDAPRREECTAQRPRSNTPLAALTLLNDPTFVEAARVLAARVLREGGDATDDRLDYAFRQALSRRPDEFERDAMEQLLAKSAARYEASPQAARELVDTGLAPAKEDLDVVEVAAWTAVTRAILNLDETITRN